jgi:alanine transaminase
MPLNKVFIIISYYLRESRGWEADYGSLEQIYQNSVNKGIIPKAFVVINPGNPTGQVMSRESLKNIV